MNFSPILTSCLRKLAYISAGIELSVRDVERLVKVKQDEKSGKTRAKKSRTREAFYDEVEIAMTQSIGRKVTVKVRPNAKGKGTLEFDFFSKDDLTKLANALSEALNEE